MKRKLAPAVALVLVLLTACNQETEGFGDWDLDADTKIDRQEFEDRWYQAGYWHVYDRDKDGVIDEEEWNKSLDEYYEDFDREHFAAYPEYDLDHDGILNEEELAEGMFVFWDTDGDGHIEESEFRERSFVAEKE